MSRATPEERRRGAPPLDAAGLERLALRYVERFATTRGRLSAYLTRKIRERGWVGDPADPAGLAEHLAGLGYIDDRAFGEARAAAMLRRGLGRRRVAGALRAAGIDGEDADAIAPKVAAGATAAAFAFARRRRIGPFAAEPADRAVREKQIAAMIRAGHDIDIARKIAKMAPGEGLEAAD
ncbi:RecX family transcriptional regulator [Sphingomonas sp. NFR15]|uniref:RecX family transcriptional regulator n=1 Tax=Sphingomonas sp. NFR15 TaxID=1566282 RepID=UPI0008877CCA|nr:RecX family transcriptional regulator [Sphingomonas sp. NFR15]SDA20969.1 regulatory protein [Sphingomonas sp. NFR15]